MNEDKNAMTKLTTEYAKLLYSVFIEFRLSAGLTPSNKIGNSDKNTMA